MRNVQRFKLAFPTPQPEVVYLNVAPALLRRSSAALLTTSVFVFAKL